MRDCISQCWAGSGGIRDWCRSPLPALQIALSRFGLRAGLLGLASLLMSHGLHAEDRPESLTTDPDGVRVYEIPVPAPEFNLRTLSGAERTLGDYEGRVVLLGFWASWCNVCRSELPAKLALDRALPDDSFELVLIAVADEPADVRRLLARHDAEDVEVLLDQDQRTTRDYRAAGVPVSYLLDREGRMLAGVAGAYPWDDPEAVALIEELIERTGEGAGE